MLAKDFKVGKRMKHKEFKFIIEVQEIEGNKLWVNLDKGDTYSFIDEDLYYDLDYYKK